MERRPAQRRPRHLRRSALRRTICRRQGRDLRGGCGLLLTRPPLTPSLPVTLRQGRAMALRISALSISLALFSACAGTLAPREPGGDPAADAAPAPAQAD